MNSESVVKEIERLGFRNGWVQDIESQITIYRISVKIIPLNRTTNVECRSKGSS